jgi:protein phosphatase
VALLIENRNALTRCIGQPPPLEGDYSVHTVLPHDRYLFATDGITRFLTAAEIAGILGNADNPADAATRLVDKANDRGGLDNATAVVLFFD